MSPGTPRHDITAPPGAGSWDGRTPGPADRRRDDGFRASDDRPGTEASGPEQGVLPEQAGPPEQVTRRPVAPSREDPVVRTASAVAGGPAGRRLASAVGPWRFAALPVLLAMAFATLALGVVERQHCREFGWTTPDQFWHACYSDIPVLYGSAGLGGADRPGLAEAAGPTGLGLPPVTSAAMWLVSAVVPGDTAEAPRRFFDLSVVLLAALLYLAVVAVAVAAGRRRWDAAHLALSPVVVTAGLVSYQLLAATLLALTFWAWSRGRLLTGGVLLGLAVAAGGVLLGLIGVAVVLAATLARRARPDVARPGRVIASLGVAVLTWYLAGVLVLGRLGAGVGPDWSAWRTAPPGYGSIWLVPQLIEAARPRRPHWWFRWGGIEALGGGVASGLALLALTAFAGALAWWVLRGSSLPGPGPLPAGAAWPPGRVDVRPLARLSLALVVAGFLCSTSLPVQASVLLLPLVALAGLRWRDHLIWATTECAYFVAVWLYIAAQSDPNRGLPASFYVWFLLARLGGIAWLGVQALRPPAPEPA